MTLIVDSHFHMYRTAADGLAAKGDYEIWEYGERAEPVYFSGASGDEDSAKRELAAAGVSVAVVATLYERREGDGDPRDELIAFDEWVCAVASRERAFYPLIGVDPSILSIADNVALVERLASEAGARGIKIHPPLQRLDLADTALWPIFATCERLGLVVLSHSGPSRDGSGRGTPDSFRPLLTHFPNLSIVLAHMGGGAWHETAALASDFPNVRFDICEIIERLGSATTPTPREFAQLIQRIGVARVFMGSDFPWYDVGHTVKLVEDLPLLTQQEKDAILGLNAADFLRLAV